MKLCVEDEVKIRLDKVRNLFFGDLLEFVKYPGRFAKKEIGIILESDYTKKHGSTYFVEFQSNIDLRFWFKEDELDLV